MSHEILHDTGRVTHEIAKAFAESEFEKYRIVQDRMFESDFDHFLALEEQAAKKRMTDKREPPVSRLGGSLLQLAAERWRRQMRTEI